MRVKIIAVLASVLLCGCIFTLALAEQGPWDAGEPLEGEAFIEASSAMVREYAPLVACDDPGHAYASGRLIVRAKGELPAPEAYAPDRIIRDDEGHYVIQFLSADEAQACANFLSAQPAVEYVEPDQIIRVDAAEG